MGNTTTPTPTCLFCGKKLRKYTYTIDVPAGGAMPEVGQPYTPLLPRCKLPVVSWWKGEGRVTLKAGDVEVVINCGQWGAYGDNFFCGLRCAAYFGRSAARAGYRLVKKGGA